MTIKDIAKAANVSAATVSRIINHKDDNISQETRERVLKIIEEYDYVPYAKIRDRILSHSRSIALMVPSLDASFYVRFATVLQKLALEHNYSLMLALSGGSDSEEQIALESFSQNRVDGILIFSGSARAMASVKQLQDQGVAVLALDHLAKPASVPQLFRDSRQIALSCTQQLLDNNCSQIALVLRPYCSQELRDTIVDGYSAALGAAGIPLQQNLVVTLDQRFVENFRGMTDLGLNGILCQDADIAQAVYAAAANDDLRIPEDISVIAMEDASAASGLTPALTAASTDVEQMAQLAFTCLLAQINHNPLPFSSHQMDCPICRRGSIRQRSSSKPRILVTGYINTDVMLQTPDLPQFSKTQVACHIADYVGGKGANQAYGISRLGGNVYLLGRLGADHRGRAIYEHLTQAGVKMDGVSFLPGLPTGAAYISLYPNGKSSVLIDPGANASLDAGYIRQQEALLRDAGYCLCQTDIPLETVAELRRLCDQKQIPMILSSAYNVRVPDWMLRDLFILILKDQDREKLYPHCADREDCARYLLSLGAQNVIFTRGRDGSVWAAPGIFREYPGYDYPCADETGTSDVFIGCLVTLLSEGRTMEDALFAATWAAAYSATRLGVQSGFPDRSLLEDVINRRMELRFPAEETE